MVETRWGGKALERDLALWGKGRMEQDVYHAEAAFSSKDGPRLPHSVSLSVGKPIGLRETQPA